MIFDYKNIEFEEMKNFKGGDNSVYAKMFFDGLNRIMVCKIPKGASIGFHKHEGSSEIIYALEGEAEVLQDGTWIPFKAGQGHYCPEGEEHSMRNVKDQDFIAFAVIPSQKREA